MFERAEEAAPRSSWEPQIEAEHFVAVSRFVVANGMEAEVHQALRERPHRVDDAKLQVGAQVVRALRSIAR